MNEILSFSIEGLSLIDARNFARKISKDKRKYLNKNSRVVDGFLSIDTDFQIEAHRSIASSVKVVASALGSVYDTRPNISQVKTLFRVFVCPVDKTEFLWEKNCFSSFTERYDVSFKGIESIPISISSGFYENGDREGAYASGRVENYEFFSMANIDKLRGTGSLYGAISKDFQPDIYRELEERLRRRSS